VVRLEAAKLVAAHLLAHGYNSLPYGVIEDACRILGIQRKWRLIPGKDDVCCTSKLEDKDGNSLDDLADGWLVGNLPWEDLVSIAEEADDPDYRWKACQRLCHLTALLGLTDAELCKARTWQGRLCMIKEAQRRRTNTAPSS